MRRTVGITVSGNAFRVDLDLTTVSFQRIRLRIAAEVGKTDEARVLLALRHLNQLVRFPELSKRRQGHALTRAALAGDLIESFQPLQIGFALGKALPAPLFPALAQVSKDLKIVPGFVLRGHDLLHRHQMLVAVVAGHGEIVTFKGGGGRQDDIRVFRSSGPVALGDHHQLRLLPGADQAIGILVMGKVCPARPPDKANVREVPVHAVVLVRAARVFQRLDDARHRDFIDRIHAALNAALHRRQHRRPPRRVAAVGKVVGETKAAARGADLSEHGREGHQHPVLLLAVLLALHPPAGHQHGGVFME